MKDLPTWSDLNKGVRKMTDREKQIQIDAEQIRALQKQNGELTDKVKELEEKLANADYQLEGREVELKELNKKLSQAETDYDKMFWQKNEIISNLQAQIEKMKCCTNCRYCIKEWGEVNPNSPNCKKCNNKSNWKLRR